MLNQSNQPTRGKVLEEAFFYQVDRELNELLSKRLHREEKIQLFADATGIRSQKHLELLADSGFELSTLHFVWVPLILVAWADGNAEKLEKEAIAAILASKGISQETICRVIAHDWFRKKPAEELWELWAEFSAATSASLNPAIYNELIDEIVRLCRRVADASGGFMGLGKISATETQVIDRVILTLQQPEEDRAQSSSSSGAARALKSEQNGVGPCLTQEPTRSKQAGS
jgi:uncharacterized tellurite resistance protein B-like protein